MKSLRKILAVLTATAMVAGMGVMSFAQTGNIVIKSNDSGKVDDRDYTYYRLLDATYAPSGATTEQDITTIAYTVPEDMKPFYVSVFGETPSGTTTDQFVTEKIAALKTADDVQNFLGKFKTWIANNSGTFAGTTYTGTETGANNKVTFSGVPSGYYVIIDNSTEKPISAFMLDTLLNENLEITLKANKDTPDKSILGPSGSSGTKVYDASGTYLGDMNDFNEIAAGSTVNYSVKEHVPNYAGYVHYYYILEDTFSEGLTFNDDVEVYIDLDGDHAFTSKDVPVTIKNDRPTSGTDGKQIVASGTTHLDDEKLERGKDYFVHFDYVEGHPTFVQIAFDDIMQFPVDADILITYSANLNKYAITGVNPNTNEARIRYSDRGQSTGSGTTVRKDKSGTSGVPADDIKDITDVGPSDWTDTYTTELKVTKVDGNGNALAGAQFTLTGNSSAFFVENQTYFEADPSGSYWMTKSGTYTLDPPVNGDYMTEAGSGANAGYVIASAQDYASGTDAEKLTWVYWNGNMYRPYDNSRDTNETVYILMRGTNDKYASTTTKYTQKTKTTASASGSVPYSRVLTPSGSNVFLFDQLGAGHYILSETKVPDGYNKAGDIEFDIVWDDPDTAAGSGTTCTWRIANATQNGKDITDLMNSGSALITGKFATDIQNTSGVELPSTGGIGTTIFYAGGAILVLLAGILLVSKRRFA